jgi:mono/diheme cytochrome c family protein
MDNSTRFQWQRSLLNATAISAGLVAGIALLASAEGGKVPPAAKRAVDFKKDIQPLLKDHCLKCHGASRKEAGLRLDRRDDALNGGDSGPIFVSGKSDESRLIQYVAGVDPDVVMPPEGEKLTDDQIGLLRAWIDQGAKWPEE